MILKYFTQWKYRINFLKTVLFNFRFFPVSIAIKFPVYIANSTILRNLSGTVVLPPPPKLMRGMIRIGFRDMGIQHEKDRKTILDIRRGSNLIFRGGASIGGGARIYTKGDLVLGDNFYLSLNSQLIAHNMVAFGNDCTVGWDVLIMDTDFHTVFNYETKEAYSMTNPILIGNHCWICNGSQLLKGTELPDDCIVGAMSLCNKRYDVPNHSLIAGIPAELKKRNVTHVR